MIIKNEEREKEMENNIYQALVNSIKSNPRNIQSTKRRLWSYYKVEHGKIVVSSGTMANHNSKISTPRTLNETEAEIVYRMWKKGIPRQEITAITMNSSYWFALFEDILG